MFLYIKDYFQKQIYHIFLIIFCGLLIFNSIMTLVDLKNYEVVIDYSADSNYYQSLNIGEKTQITFERPSVNIKYKYAATPYKLTWVSSQLLDRYVSIENYTIAYKVYSGSTDKDLIDSFTTTYYKFNTDVNLVQKEYEHNVRAVILDVVDYDINFNAKVYLPHIFVITVSLFFIVPSVAMLCKIKKEKS